MSRQRAPIERLIDFTLAVPRSCARAGRLTTRALIRQARPAQRHQVADARRSTTADAPAESPSVNTTPRHDSVAVDDLPLDGYDDLAARQVVDRLAALSASDRSLIEAYERAHRNRSTVLGMIARLAP